MIEMDREEMRKRFELEINADDDCDHDEEELMTMRKNSESESGNENARKVIIFLLSVKLNRFYEWTVFLYFEWVI